MKKSSHRNSVDKKEQIESLQVVSDNCERYFAGVVSDFLDDNLEIPFRHLQGIKNIPCYCLNVGIKNGS